MATGWSDEGDDYDDPSCVTLGGTWKVSMLKVLGRGTFGTVYRGRHIQNKGRVAVKKLEVPDDLKGKEAMEEIKNFQRMDAHPNVIYLYDFHFRNKAFWMIMEFCNEGDLNNFMKSEDRSMDLRYDIMMQTTSGLAHMHCMAVPIVHRDIKPANLLMKKKDGHLLVKITDFGLSKMVDPATMVQTAMFNTQCGTPGYMAPELFKQVPYGPPVDVFALGLVFLALIYVRKGQDLLPLSVDARKSMNIMPIGQEMCMKAQMNQPMPNIVGKNSKDDPKVAGLKNLIEKMTPFDPKKRPSMKVIEQELSKITGTTYKPREVKSGLPLFNRRGEEEAAGGATANEGSEGTRDRDGDIAFQFMKDALDERKAGVLDKLSDDKRRKEEARRMEAMNVLEILAYLKDKLDTSGDDSCKEKFDIGDRVRVKPDLDQESAEQLQKDHGEWNARMGKYFGEVGYVKQASRTKVVVKFRDGETWIWNPLLLEKFDGPDPPLSTGRGRHAVVAGMFKPMDIVRTPDDKEMLKCLQEMIGMKWTDKMEKCVGKTGIVHKIDRDGDVVVELINGLSGPFNPEGLVHVDHAGEDVEPGDMVLVLEDREKVRSLQEGHGGWNAGMAKALGKAGMVTRIMRNGRAVVDVGSNTWHFNVQCLKLVVKGDELFRECRE